MLGLPLRWSLVSDFAVFINALGRDAEGDLKNIRLTLNLIHNSK